MKGKYTMGQYHAIYNLDQKECLTAHNSCSGSKLLEMGYTPHLMTGLLVLLANSNGRGGGDLAAPYDYKKVGDRFEDVINPRYANFSEALKEVQGRWAGDRIVIQGDYAKESDRAFISEQDSEAYRDISKLVMRAVACNEELGEAIASDSFADRHPEILHVYGKKQKSPASV